MKERNVALVVYKQVQRSNYTFDGERRRREKEKNAIYTFSSHFFCHFSSYYNQKYPFQQLATSIDVEKIFQAHEKG